MSVNLPQIAFARATMRMVALSADTEDRVTSLSDCRAAVCLARGVSVDDMDPSSGHDISDRAYRVARDSWAPLAAKGSYRHGDYERALSYWSKRRPELVADWPAWGTGGAS